VQLPDLKKLIRSHNRGLLTDQAFQLDLVLAAAELPPERIVELLRPQVVAELRKLSREPPADPGKVRIIESVCEGPDFSQERYEAYLREQARLWFEGVWRWHHYFQGKPTDGAGRSQGDRGTGPGRGR
jgi:hypothetical protein